MALSWTLGTAACEPFDVVLATQGGSEIDPEPDSGTGLPSPDGAACSPPRAAVVADGDVTGSVCTRAFAAQVFQRGLCTCGDADIGALATYGFDSRAEIAGGGPGGPVGITGVFRGGTSVSVGDELVVAGQEPVRLLVSLTTAGDLRLAGPLTVTGRLEVLRDAWLHGVTAPIGSIGRDLYLADGTERVGAISVAGLTQSVDFEVDAPCPCDDRSLLDIPKIVAEAELNNDNAKHGLQPSVLSSSSAPELAIPCGRFYLDRVEVSAPTRLRVGGRTALFVAGDFVMRDLEIVLEPNAELDLFIAGRLRLIDSAAFAAVTRPAGARVYVGGDVSLGLGLEVVGGLYAPHASLTALDTRLLVHGALFVQSVTALGVELHHDRALTVPCEAPSPAK